MKTRHYKNRSMQQTYDAIMAQYAQRGRDLFHHDQGEIHPHRCNAWASAFWKGYFGEGEHLVARGTLSWPCYTAGIDCRRTGPGSFTTDGKYVGPTKRNPVKQRG